MIIEMLLGVTVQSLALGLEMLGTSELHSIFFCFLLFMAALECFLRTLKMNYIA